MNKTKKYKYLRKNRHSKRITRKIQRGGNPPQRQPPPPPPPSPPPPPPTLTAYEKSRFANAITAQKAAAAAASAASAASVSSPNIKNWTYGYERDWVPPPQPLHPQPQQPNSQLPFDIPRKQEQPLPAVSKSEEKPRLPQKTKEEIDNMDPETRVAYLSNNANKKNESRERPDRRISLLAKAIPNAVLGKLAAIGSESQQKLVKEEVLTTFTGDLSKIIEDSEDQVEIIREYNRLLNEEIKEIYKEIVLKGEINEEQKEDIKNLLGDVRGNNEYIKQLTTEASQLFHAMESGNLAAFETIGYGTPLPTSTGPGKSSNKPGATSSSTRQLSSSTRSGLSSLFSNNPSKDPAAAEAKAAAKAAAAAEKEARKAQAQAFKDEQRKNEEAAGLTRRKGLLGRTSDSVINMGKTMGTAFSNAGKTVKLGLINLKNRVTTRKNNGEDKEPLIPKESSTTADQSGKTVVSSAPSPPPPPPSPPSPPPRAPPPPPSTPSTPSSSGESPGSQQTRTPPPTPAEATRSDGRPDRPLPPPAGKVHPPTSPRPFKVLSADMPFGPLVPSVAAGGGNITRKNRQYIHEIKDNRTHLFNKEMEIINSIRNFKHGLGRNEHGKNKPENIQKKFIKVIKRS